MNELVKCVLHFRDLERVCVRIQEQRVLGGEEGERSIRRDLMI